MLKINGNKLSAAGIQFALPEEHYIDIEGMEAVSENGIKFVSDREDYYISFMTSEEEYTSSRASIDEIFIDTVLGDSNSYKIIQEPKDYECNGLKGTCVQYESKYDYYYEIHFERADGFDSQAEVLICVDKDMSDLETALNKQTVKDFFNSFVLHK